MKIVSSKSYSDNQLTDDASATLRAGGLVVVPSDTVYGMSVDAKNQSAVSKLIQFKERPKGKAISIFVGDLNKTGDYVAIGSKQQSILHTFIPGSYTVILPSRKTVDSRLESENGTLGIRIPDFEFINRLVMRYGSPITATSANRAGDSPHYSIESFLNSLSEKKKQLIDLIIDFGKLPRHKPSTVVDLTGDQLQILRVGTTIPDITYVSHSEKETQTIASYFLTEKIAATTKKPLVVILKGDLGAGKTIFVKGVGESLGIKQIVSPTYIICNEYACSHHGINTLHHCDFYNIHEEEEFSHLGLAAMLRPGTIICIEWGEKGGAIINNFKRKAEVYLIEIKHKAETEREILIQKL